MTALGSGNGSSPNPPTAPTPPGADNVVRLSALTRSAATSSGPAAGSVQFQFQSEAGRHYRLEGTPDLASGQWEVLLDQIEGTGGPPASD